MKKVIVDLSMIITFTQQLFSAKIVIRLEANEMLNVIFQRSKAKNPDDIIEDSRFFFSKNKKKEWFEDPFVQQIIHFVDKAEVIDGMILKDRFDNIIPPEYLSTGSKTAICVYEYPDKIFNMTQMGDNALAFITGLSKSRDITLLCYRLLPYCQMIDTEFYKDYVPVDISDPDDFDTLMEEWLEEIGNG